MLKQLNNTGFNNLNQIWKQESEWRELLSLEITALQQSLTEKNALISDQNVHLEDVKKSFIFNYELLQARDAEIVNFEKNSSRLKSLLKERDAEISELKITTDQLRHDLVVSHSETAEWRSQFEAESTRVVQQEAELRSNSTKALTQLSDSESKERWRLNTQLTRLQADLEGERVRAKAELDSALSAANRSALEAASEAMQSQLALEMRVSLAEESAARSRSDARRRTGELEMAESSVAQLKSELASSAEAVQTFKKNASNLEEVIETLHKQQSAMEVKLSRQETRWKIERNSYLKQIEDAAIAERNRAAEAATMQETLQARVDEGLVEHRRLLDTISRSEKQADEAKKCVRECERERQVVLRRARLSEIENRRLREDLESALSVNNNHQLKTDDDKIEAMTENEKKKRQQLTEQVITLRFTCGQLEQENARLKEAISQMSLQAQNEAKLCDETESLRQKLSDSESKAKCLIDEKNSLLQLSNRLQAAAKRVQVQSSQNPSDDKRQLKQECHCTDNESQSRGLRTNQDSNDEHDLDVRTIAGNKPSGSSKHKLGSNGIIHLDKELGSPRKAYSNRPPLNKTTNNNEFSSSNSSSLTGHRSALSALNLLQEYPCHDNEDDIQIHDGNSNQAFNSSAYAIMSQCKQTLISSRRGKTSRHFSNPIRPRMPK